MARASDIMFFVIFRMSYLNWPIIWCSFVSWLLKIKLYQFSMQSCTRVVLDSPNTNSNAGGEKHIQKASFFIYHIETKSFTGNHMPCWWWSTRVSRVQFVFDVFGNPSVVTSIVYVFFTRIYTNFVDLNNDQHPLIIY